MFVRLTGCNLRCRWCDTKYAFQGGENLSIDEIIHRIETIREENDLIEITGGEPLLQKNVYELIDKLIALNRTVLIETSGSLPIERMNGEAHIIMDIKCPSSGESEKNYWPNLNLISPKDEIKFVVADLKDFCWATQIVKNFDLFHKTPNILFSPVADELPPNTLAKWILDSALPIRMQIQLHKIIWPHTPRGV